MKRSPSLPAFDERIIRDTELDVEWIMELRYSGFSFSVLSHGWFIDVKDYKFVSVYPANPQGVPSQASAVFPSVRSGGSAAQACSDDSAVHSEEVQGKARISDVSEAEEEVVLFVPTVCCEIGINKREAQLR